ncbi:hypothetical protein AVEN_99410-1, partial [Araneus ventricosus]
MQGDPLDRVYADGFGCINLLVASHLSVSMKGIKRKGKSLGFGILEATLNAYVPASTK